MATSPTPLPPAHMRPLSSTSPLSPIASSRRVIRFPDANPRALDAQGSYQSQGELRLPPSLLPLRASLPFGALRTEVQPPQTRKAAGKSEKTPRGSRKKDPKAPKRALSAYMYFSQDWRERMKQENPEASFGTSFPPL